MCSIQVKCSLVDDCHVLFQNVSQIYKHQTSVLQLKHLQIYNYLSYSHELHTPYIKELHS